MRFRRVDPEKQERRRLRAEQRRAKRQELIRKGKETLSRSGAKSKKAIPSVFTIGNAFFGFLALIAVAEGDIIRAVAFLLIGNILDALDGHLARKMSLESAFGLELDSLADTVSFVIVPAAMIYFVFFNNFLGEIVGACAALCGILRLARFNIQETKEHYIGISTPLFTLMVATLALVKVLSPNSILLRIQQQDMALIFILLSLMMVSPVRYPAFRQPYMVKYKGRILLAAVIFGIAALILDLYTWQAIVLEHVMLWLLFLLPLLFEPLKRKRLLLIFDAGFLALTLFFLTVHTNITLLLVFPVFYLILGMPMLAPCFDSTQ